MMGPSHAWSGMAVWTAGTAALVATATLPPIDPAMLLLGAAIFSGAALFPDMDSKQATVTRSLGIFGVLVYYLINGLSLFIYNATKTKYDSNIENGHRTLTHTIVFAILAGLAVLGLTSIPGTLTLGGDQYTISQIIAVVIMGFFLNVGLGGIFAKQIKKARNKYGPYILILLSITVSFITALLLPPISYQWIAALVTIGMIVHSLGDAPTKSGAPLLAPLIKIKGKRWYDVSLPSFMRFTTGGAVETKLLLPLFILLSAVGASWHALMFAGVL